jgi:hypothetical protein
MYRDLSHYRMHSFIIFAVNDNHAITAVISQRLRYVATSMGGTILLPWQLVVLSTRFALYPAGFFTHQLKYHTDRIQRSPSERLSVLIRSIRRFGVYASIIWA